MSETMSIDQLKRSAKQSEKQRLENKFLDAFAAVKPKGVPMPEREWRFDEVRRWRFDLVWPAIKLAVEIQGGSFVGGAHNRGAHQASDYEKHNAASILGWTVLYFGTVQMKDAVACAAETVDMIAVIGHRKAS